MTRLAEDAAAALDEIVEPGVPRERRAHTVDQVHRSLGGGHLLAEPAREGREWSVEPDRQAVVVGAGGPDLVDLVASQAERLLDEHGLSGAERGGGDLR